MYIIFQRCEYFYEGLKINGLLHVPAFVYWCVKANPINCVVCAFDDRTLHTRKTTNVACIQRLTSIEIDIKYSLLFIKCFSTCSPLSHFFSNIFRLYAHAHTCTYTYIHIHMHTCKYGYLISSA